MRDPRLREAVPSARRPSPATGWSGRGTRISAIPATRVWDGSHRRLIISGLTPQSTYYVRVAASTVSGEGFTVRGAECATTLAGRGAHHHPNRAGRRLSHRPLGTHPRTTVGRTSLCTDYSTGPATTRRSRPIRRTREARTRTPCLHASPGLPDKLTGSTTTSTTRLESTQKTTLCCGYVSRTVTGTPTASPLAPPTIAEKSATTNSITVNWAAPSHGPEATGYDLRWRSRNDSPSLANLHQEATGLAGTSYTITGFTPRHRLRYSRQGGQRRHSRRVVLRLHRAKPGPASPASPQTSRCTRRARAS